MTAVSEQVGHWVEQFTGQPASPFRALREAGFRRFTELGFPTTHDEEWRFTNVAPIARRKWDAAKPAAPGDVDQLAPWTAGQRLVFVNGFPTEQVVDLPKGVSLGNLDESALEYLGKLLPDRRGSDSSPDPDQIHDREGAVNAFVALNTAFVNHGAYVRVARGTIVEQPLHVVYVTLGQGAYVAPRSLVVVGPDAQVTVVETYVGAGEYFTNAVTEIVAAQGSVVDHYKVTVEAAAAQHIANLQATVGRSANFSSHSISLGGALVRNDVGTTLSEGTEATLNGLYIVNGTQHIDNHTSIDHVKPHASSHELYKGILDGKSSAVFNGRIIVRQDAQKTDSKQTNKNLVLSDEAVIDTKPELQIWADDVKCTHGATIGQLDAESLFYLRSRGIDKNNARSLLTYAFAQDIIDRVKVSSVRDSLERILFEKFNEHTQ